MAKGFLFVFALFSMLSGGMPPAAAQENSLNADLNKILASFDTKQGFDPHNAGGLDKVISARGTLVFFDNSHSTGQTPDLSGVFGKKKPNIVRRTLEKAKARLFGSSAEQPRPTQADAPSPLQQQEIYASQPTGPKLMTLDYTGAKTIAAIPPDTYVEVPFVRHIPYYFSRIEVLANDTISVSETIQRVVDPSEEDFTGIDRLFPKYHADRSGKKHRTDLTVLSAEIDGKPVDAALKPDKFGVRIAMHGDKPLAPGVHVFTLTYLFADKIAEFDNTAGDSRSFKELIWNVTGQHWDIPVTRAGAIVIYPRGAKIFSRSALTGDMRQPQHDVRIKRDSENDTAFTLTYPLAPFEGLILITNWAESDAAPVYNATLDRFLREHGTALTAFLAFLFVCSYYLATWISLKKNQVPASTQALSVKKDDLNPAVVYYARCRQTVPKTLFVLLLDMAGKGFLSFEQNSQKQLTLIKQTDSTKSLSALEKTVAKKLFPKEETAFKMTAANALRLTRLLQTLDGKMKREYKSKFVTFQQTYFWFGILMAAISVVTVASLSPFALTTGITAFIAVACFVPLYFSGEKLFSLLKRGVFSNNRRALTVPTLTALAFLAGLSQALHWYAVETTWVTAVWFAAALICIAVFYSLLQSPSLLGKTLAENLEGYKIYLSSQDDTLLATMRNADRKIKTLYNKHLPFAVALDVDRLWTKRFSAFANGNAKLAPDWYAGNLPFDENFTDALFTAFSTVFPAPARKKKNS